MRLLVHTDQAYRLDEHRGVWTGRAFAIFVGALADHLDRVTIVGRLESGRGPWHHRLPDGLRFCGLPSHDGPARPWALAAAAARSLRRFWRALDDADVVWLLGPNLLTAPFAAMALARRRRVVLGVRQELPAYLRTRHPGRRLPVLAGRVLESIFALLARRLPIVTVGPALTARYSASPDLLEVFVSLISAGDVVERPPAARPAGADRRILTVTRLDAEKNPLLLADVLARLGEGWRLVVCGDGPMRDDLARRLDELGVAHQAELAGYVPAGDPLRARYRDADAFLHVSWTEGLPQVLFEAFAAGLPTVATDVGGVAAGAGDGALLIEPGDAEAAARALEGLLADEGRRSALAGAALRRARSHTIEEESRRVAHFLARQAQSSGPSSSR
jgi:glycosyltransferase involved in cell wall biosynthesis